MPTTQPSTEARTRQAAVLEVPQLLGGLAATLFALLVCGDPVSALAVGAVGYSLVWYFNSLGRSVAIVETVSVIAGAQWILGPFFAYYFGWVDIRYRMYVDAHSYFQFVFPAFLLMMVGMKIAAPPVDLERFRSFVVKRHGAHARIAGYAIAIGVAATFLGDTSGSLLGFVFFLLAQLKFVGAIYLIIYRSKWRWPIAAGVFLLELSGSAEQGMFHNLLLWGALTLSFVCLDLRLDAMKKLVLLATILFAITTLQGAKDDYRRLIRQDPSRAGLATLVGAMNTNVSRGLDARALNTRLNQGWIISAVMLHVPTYTRFEYGRTIVQAVADSATPRVLLSKRAVVQSDSFRRYTGMKVARNTTFGISVLGEAWVNFGYFGALFMGAMGVMYGLVLKGLVNGARSEPTLFLWAPLLFLQAVKAETELAVVLNHLTKSLIFVLVVYYILKMVGGAEAAPKPVAQSA